MTDSRRSGAAVAVATSIAVLLVGGVVAPAALVFWGVFPLSPFLGQQPTVASRATAAAWCWAGFVVSAVAFAAAASIAVVYRRRAGAGGLTALVLLAVLTGVAGGFWLVVAELSE